MSIIVEAGTKSNTKSGNSTNWYKSCYVNEKTVPDGLLTKKQIKALDLRLKKKAKPVADFLTVFTSFRLPHKRHLASVPEADLKVFGRYLADHGPFVPDEAADDVTRLSDLGYVVFTNLYRREDCEDARLPSEVKRYHAACDQLYKLFFDGADSWEHIVTVDGQRATWKGTKPSIDQHLTGEIVIGPKKGATSRWISLDADNHDAVNDPGFVAMVRTLLDFCLGLGYPLLAEINK
jgi:hypothetical protein